MGRLAPIRVTPLARALKHSSMQRRCEKELLAEMNAKRSARLTW